MPAAQKTSWAALRVGVMAMAAMAIIAVLIFHLTGSGDLFSNDATLRTFMDDSAAMVKGSPVRLNGILVGDISSISLTGSNEEGKVVEIRMRVKQEFLSQIPEDSEVEISAANLLGDKFINIKKGKSKIAVKDGGTLRATPAQDIPELMSRAGDILGNFQKMVARFDLMLGDIEAGKGNIGKFLRDEELYARLNATVSEAHKVIAAVNSGKGTLGRLLNDEALYEEMRAPIQRVDAILADIQQGRGTAGKLLKDPAMYDELRQTVADIRRLVTDLNEGKGTAGKLLKDDALYKQMNQLVAKLDSSIDKMNSGQGTLGQLIVNPQLYESLNGATREMQSLVKDIRANPKKFLRIKLALF